jgi:hypothetical protein
MKRGQLMGLADNVVALGVIAIVIAFVALILSQTKTQVVAIAGANSVADNATAAGLTAMNTFGQWLSIIAVVVIAGMILYLLFRTLMGGKGDSG